MVMDSQSDVWGTQLDAVSMTFTDTNYRVFSVTPMWRVMTLLMLMLLDMREISLVVGDEMQ